MSNLVFNAGLFTWLGDWFYNLWISLWLLIDNVVYVCINWMYRVFILVSKVDIFGGGDQIKEIVERLYLIVGIAMLFIFAYNLILLIINPEGNQLGNMGKVIQNALISIILVTLLPLIFSYMSTIQSHIIDSNVIGHIILGTSNDPDADPDNKKAGVDTAMTIFSAFYHPKDETLYSCKNGGTAAMCSKYISVYDTAYNNDDITGFIWDDDLKDGLKNDEMEYTYFLSTAAGIFALWMFISFGLDIGIRVGKLAFYQLISPIPVMMRILPGDKMFGKWFSGLKDTYISLFVRLAVIYFCMYAITLVPDVLSGMWATSGDNVIILALANVLVILGILKFAQEAPKLIGDLFGGKGGLDFSIGKKVKDNKLAMAGMGGIGAGLGAMAGNAWNSWKNIKGGKGNAWNNTKAIAGGLTSGIGGFFGGARRGVVGGYKSGSFRTLGKNITDSKIKSDEARNRHAATRKDGAIKGHEIPIISGAWGGLKNAGRNIKSGVENAGEWISGTGPNAFIASAIGAVKNANKTLKDDSRYKFKKIDKSQVDAWVDLIRRGENVTYNGHDYNGTDATSREDAIKNLRDAVKIANRHQVSENYKNNADFASEDLKDLLEKINENRNVYGPKTNEYLYNRIEKLVDPVNGDKTFSTELKTELQSLIDTSTNSINWDNMSKLLSLNISDLQSDSTVNVAKRQAIYELNDVIDKAMTDAQDHNRRMEERKNSE